MSAPGGGNRGLAVSSPDDRRKHGLARDETDTEWEACPRNLFALRHAGKCQTRPTPLVANLWNNVLQFKIVRMASRSRVDQINEMVRSRTILTIS